LRTLSKPLSKTLQQEERKEKVRTEKKTPEKNIAKPLYPVPAHPWHGRAQWHGCATQYGQAVPLFWPAWSCWFVGTRSGALMHARSLPVLRVLSCSWCAGLPRTSTLLLNPPKMLFLLPKPEGSSGKHRIVVTWAKSAKSHQRRLIYPFLI